MRIRPALFIAATAVGGVLGGAALAAALDDPATTVAPAVLSGTVAPADTVATPGTTPGTDAGTTGAASTDSDTTGVTVREVDGLDQLVGTLRSGDDPEDWYVSGVEVDFGPDGWISAAPAFEDYDADGSVEPLLDELRGLDGREVTLGIRYEIDDDDRDDADAYVIEGLSYRDPAGGPAPWQAAPAGVEADADRVAEAAAAAVGEGAVTREVERENDDGWIGWDVEVLGADGREYQVHLDLTGAVIDVRPDND